MSDLEQGRPDPTFEVECGTLHDFRKQIDACIKRADGLMANPGETIGYDRELLLAKTKLQEAKMWIGKCLEIFGSQLPEEYRDESKQ